MLCDVRQSVLSDLVEFYQVDSTTDVAHVMASDKVDAVYVGLDGQAMAQVGLQVLQAGKHLLLETLAGLSLRQVDALVSASETAGVSLGVVMGAQADAAVAVARDYVRAGVLGQVRAAHIEVPAGVVSGAQLLDQLNTLLWVTDQSATRATAEASEGGILSGLVCLESGAVAMVRVGAETAGAEQIGRGPRIYGSKGQLALGASPTVYWQDAPEGGTQNAWQVLRFSGPRGDRARIVEAFAAAAGDGRQPAASAVAARRALALAVASGLAASAETGASATL